MKSVRLKKYGIAYNLYMNSIEKESHPCTPIAKSSHGCSTHRHSKKVDSIPPKEKPPKEKPPKEKPLKEKPVSESVSKRLNDYQKFVKNESSKEKYENMKGSERLSAISFQWEKKKRKRKQV
jgi:hypothetical protein